MNTISPSGPMLLTIADTSRELGASPDTVRRLINTGKLPTVELDTGKSMKPTKRVRRTDLIEFVANMAASQ